MVDERTTQFINFLQSKSKFATFKSVKFSLILIPPSMFGISIMLGFGSDTSSLVHHTTNVFDYITVIFFGVLTVISFLLLGYCFNLKKRNDKRALCIIEIIQYMIGILSFLFSVPQGLDVLFGLSLYKTVFLSGCITFALACLIALYVQIKQIKFGRYVSNRNKKYEPYALGFSLAGIIMIAKNFLGTKRFLFIFSFLSIVIFSSLMVHWSLKLYYAKKYQLEIYLPQDDSEEE